MCHDRHPFKTSKYPVAVIMYEVTKTDQWPEESHTELLQDQARSLTFEVTVVLSCKCCTFQSDGSLHGVNSIKRFQVITIVLRPSLSSFVKVCCIGRTCLSSGVCLVSVASLEREIAS